MTDETSCEAVEANLEPRTRRARTEDMLVALRKTGGIYSVRGESGNTYRVDIVEKNCTCPDQQRSTVERCKHLRRVEIELRNRTVPTPDGRLPERPVADGGVGVDVDADNSAGDRRVEGPIQELDKHGRPTGTSYFRCRNCGTEAMRRDDLSECCPEPRQ